MIQVILADGRKYLLEPELDVTLSFTPEDSETESHEFKVADIVELRMPLSEIMAVSGRNGNGDTIRCLQFRDPSGPAVTGPPMTPASAKELAEFLLVPKIDIVQSLPPELNGK